MGSTLDVTEEGRRWIARWDGNEVCLHRASAARLVTGRCALRGGADLGPVVRAALGLLAEHPAQIVTWDMDDRAALNAAFLDAGCSVHRRKHFVERDLTGELPPTLDFGWRTLAECGDRELVGVLWAASQGDPFEEGDRDPDREWKELVEGTGDELDPTLWRIALLDGAPVGVVLPTRWRGEGARGTLSYVGVLPEHRGKGLGRALHAAGLRLLRDAGVERYVGSTDERNAPMARVFVANGCTMKPVQLLLSVPAATSRA